MGPISISFWDPYICELCQHLGSPSGPTAIRWTMESTHSLRSGSSAWLQRLLILPLWFLFFAQMDATINQAEEVRMLGALRDANFVQDQGYWATWNDGDQNPCTWVGVKCTSKYTVEELDFSGWGVHFLSLDALSALVDLRCLDLSSNWLVWVDVLGNLNQLIRLDLSRNFLMGSLPSFSAFKNLRYLNLERTGLVGRFSEVISSISDLVKLQFLNLAGNFLTGPFPTEEVGGLRSLISLDFSGNSFNGSIPSLPDLTSLIELKLHSNKFTGFEEPWFLGTTNRLQHLSVSNNNLKGRIPSSIAYFRNLSYLNMSGNYLSEEIPSGFSTAMQRGMSLDLSHNNLTGEIPPDMLQSDRDIQTCSSVNVSYNLLTGNIPVNHPNPVCLLDLNLGNNNLSGPIPSSLLNNSVVSRLWLGNNKFSGDIVDAFVDLFSLTDELHLENNLFTGDLSRIANIENIQMKFIQILDLRNNHLLWSVSEAIPDPIQATLEVLTGNSIYMTEFLVGGNNFSGTSLPTTCFVNTSHYDYTPLAVVDLSNSQLDGEIFGAAFGNSCLPYIQLLNLSNNHANGSLPESIVADRPLSPNFVLDVSINNLSGPLPVIVPSSSIYNPMFFAGNVGLCGAPLAPCSQSSQRAHWWVLLIRWIKKEKLHLIVGGFAILGTGSFLFAIWQWKVYKNRHQQDADLIKTLLERESATLMPLRELKKATENFAESAQIGEGGFGMVYIGKLDNGTMVAVKRSKQEGSEKDKELFLNEVRILSQIKHRNLVKLLGCCMENKIAVLVFEFISNGTLQGHLQGKCGTVRLSWKQRLNIAIQTADALNYLHSTTIFPIYHRDVKSANILLDGNLNAKVADFGISKLAPLQATHVSTVAVQGTIGYIDPEYYISYRLTYKSDVFSFGVVLLELISAKPALDFLRGGDETSLVYFAGPFIARGDLLGLIDPALMEIYCDQVGHGRESILNVGKLAMKCLEMRSKARPNMFEVPKELQKLLVDLDGTSNQTKYATEEKDIDDNLQGDHAVLLFKIPTEERSSLAIEIDASGIQLSQLSNWHTA